MGGAIVPALIGTIMFLAWLVVAIGVWVVRRAEGRKLFLAFAVPHLLTAAMSVGLLLAITAVVLVGRAFAPDWEPTVPGWVLGSIGSEPIRDPFPLLVSIFAWAFGGPWISRIWIMARWPASRPTRPLLGIDWLLTFGVVRLLFDP